MQRLIEQDPRNREVIFPYIGGEEVNTEPDHAPRYVINFGERSEEECWQHWPDLMAVCERESQAGPRNSHEECNRPEAGKVGGSLDQP